MKTFLKLIWYGPRLNWHLERRLRGNPLAKDIHHIKKAEYYYKKIYGEDFSIRID